MTVVIDKNTPEKRMKKLLAKSTAGKKGIDISKFSGKLKWKGSVLKIQRSMRNEK
jgi:hypothetical protein